MIRLLQGQISSRDDRTIILLVNGVGYHVHVPQDILSGQESEITLFIHTHVREDALTLYGFRTKNELNFFELLLTVSGIGPKSAMDLMNQAIEKIQNAILAGNSALLTQIPGIGKKTAERMIVELKSKIQTVDLKAGPSFPAFKELNEDVISTLENLGYKRSHIQKVLSAVEEDLETTEDWIRMFLQRA